MDSMMRTPTLVFFVACAACTNTETRNDARAELRGGAYRLVVDERPRVRLLRVDDELFRLDADGLQLGLAGPVDDATTYDPYRRFVPSGLYVPPVEPTFVSPILARFEPGAQDELRLRLSYEGGREALLTARADGDGSFALAFQPTQGVEDVAYLDLHGHGSETEGFYGLGELSDDVNQRGKVRAMQLEVEATTEAGYNDAHAPIPFLIGTQGWGLFVESRLPGAFAVATEAADVVTASFGATDEIAVRCIGMRGLNCSVGLD